MNIFGATSSFGGDGSNMFMGGNTASFNPMKDIVVSFSCFHLLWSCNDETVIFSLNTQFLTSNWITITSH